MIVGFEVGIDDGVNDGTKDGAEEGKPVGTGETVGWSVVDRTVNVCDTPLS